MNQMNKYCKYCCYYDDGIYESGGEKPLWKYKGKLLGYKILLDLYIEKGKLYMVTTPDGGIYGENINFCPMCGRKLTEEQEDEQ